MAKLAPDRLKGLFETMLRMRRFEEMVIHVAADHDYIGRNHLYIGHEATGAAVMSLLRPGDFTATTHRNHGHMIARGVDPGKALAEIMGKSGGCNGGRGGTWHISDREIGFISTSAMVGGSIGLATGAAVTARHEGKGAVSVAFFGDGTLDEGISYEALNIASVFSLPLLFVCENNSKPGERPSSMLAAKALSDVPRALDIETEVVDGRDAEAVHDATARLLERVRAGKGPAFIEATLERWPGSHQMKPAFTTGITDVTLAWDEGRISGEHADWTRKHDPIRLLARRLTEDGILDRDGVIALDKRVTDEIERARDFAEKSPFPQPESALVGVFA